MKKGPKNLHQQLRRFIRPGQDADCWVYGGHLNSMGYPVIQHDKKKWKVARLVYMMYVDPTLTDDYYVMRTCKTRACVNPKHLTTRKKKLR